MLVLDILIILMKQLLSVYLKLKIVHINLVINNIK